MIPCPVCSTLMPELQRTTPRRFCSKTCAGRAASAAQILANLDLDHVNVDRLIRGEHTTATTAEHREAISHLTALGYSLFAIADRLHVTHRTVSRHRAALKASA